MGTDQCELTGIAPKAIEKIGDKLSMGRQIESEEVKYLGENSERLTS